MVTSRQRPIDAMQVAPDTPMQATTAKKVPEIDAEYRQGITRPDSRRVVLTLCQEAIKLFAGTGTIKFVVLEFLIPRRKAHD